MRSPTLPLSHDSAKPVANFLAPGQRKPLTPRQLEIVRLIVDAKTNAEIAEILNCSPHTVKKHVENLLYSLGVPNRAAAVSWWYEYGKKWSQAALES
jgi:DNA-binding CsgD family transcriptional regulator